MRAGSRVACTRREGALWRSAEDFASCGFDTELGAPVGVDTELVDPALALGALLLLVEISCGVEISCMVLVFHRESEGVERSFVVRQIHCAGPPGEPVLGSE